MQLVFSTRPRLYLNTVYIHNSSSIIDYGSLFLSCGYLHGLPPLGEDGVCQIPLDWLKFTFPNSCRLSADQLPNRANPFQLAPQPRRLHREAVLPWPLKRDACIVIVIVKSCQVPSSLRHGRTSVTIPADTSWFSYFWGPDFDILVKNLVWVMVS